MGWRWNRSLSIPLFCLSEGQPCPQILNYPQSVCRKRCPQIRELIKQKFVDQEVACNLDSICCPAHSLQSGSIAANTDPVPLYPIVKLMLGQEETSYNFSYPPLAELSYWTRSQDEHEYRCTALLVREDYVLTSAGCVGNDTSEKPDRVCFGNCRKLSLDERKSVLFDTIVSGMCSAIPFLIWIP